MHVNAVSCPVDIGGKLQNFISRNIANEKMLYFSNQMGPSVEFKPVATRLIFTFLGKRLLNTSVFASKWPTVKRNLIRSLSCFIHFFIRFAILNQHCPVRFLRIPLLSYPDSFIGYPGGSFNLDSRL